MDFNFNESSQEKMLNHNRSKFSIYDSALACILFILFSELFSICISGLDLKKIDGTIWYYFLQTGLEAVFAIAAVCVVYFRKKDIKVDTGMNKKISWPMVGWCFLVSLVCLICFGNLTNVFIELLYACGYESILGDITIGGFGDYIGYVISACFVAAFCEEFLFRGVILSGFRKFGAKIAILCSALIFMLMHGNAEQTVHQFIIGVIIGFVFYNTGNLWIGFLIHMFNNLIPITEVYFLNLVQTAETAAETTETVAISAGTIVIDLIVALVLAWAGLYFLKLLYNKIKHENDKLNPENVQSEEMSSILVDGNETDVEISIDQNANAKAVEEKPVINFATIIMFVISGLYLVGSWLLAAVAGFTI